MEINIQIKAPTFLWFLPSGLAHLTDEEPGPIKVEFDLLSKEDQKLIILGAKNNQISVDKELDELANIYSSGTVAVKKETAIATFNSDEEHPLVVSEEDLKISASGILNKVTTTIKKNVELSKDIRLLRIMLELESTTRDRKPIISCIQERLEQLSLSILQDIDSKATRSFYEPLDPLARQMEITDSEVEERVIEIE